MVTPDSMPDTAQSTPDGPLILDTTTQNFSRDVIQASMKTPVLVDFWAPWCGPCKQLTPVLEKIVEKARGAVRLVKMNIDENPEIPGQLGIQSIPAVIAFKNGQPLDGFMGAVPERQILAFIERIAGPVGPSETDIMLEQAEAAILEENWSEAARLYAGVLEQDAEHVGALAGLARCYIGSGDLDEAEATLTRIAESDADNPAVAAARAALDLARQAEDVGDTAELQTRLAADPADHEARFELAMALSARGNREEAIDNLVEIVQRNRNWNDEAARKQLLQFFEAWGPTDEMTLYGRRRLSSVLFS